jgi:hypothetical protein
MANSKGYGSRMGDEGRVLKRIIARIAGHVGFVIGDQRI